MDASEERAEVLYDEALDALTGGADAGQLSGMGRAVQTVGIDFWLIEAGAGS